MNLFCLAEQSIYKYLDGLIYRGQNFWVWEKKKGLPNRKRGRIKALKIGHQYQVWVGQLNFLGLDLKRKNGWKMSQDIFLTKTTGGGQDTKKASKEMFLF